MDLSIILPAFNEENRILHTLENSLQFLESRPWSYELIVVDDGSVDGTAEAVRNVHGKTTSVSCLMNGQNRGKGYSVRQGVNNARGSVVGYMDADYKTDIAGLDRVMESIEAGCDGVVGDRTQASSIIVRPRRGYREVGSQLFKEMVHALLGLQNLGDTQCGFKFFKKNVMATLFTKQVVDGYMFDVEILLLANRLGYSIKPIPVVWEYDPDSRFNPMTGMVKNVGELLRIYWSHRTVDWKSR